MKFENKNIIVVVLGNRLNDDGSITEIQKERLELALELEKEYKPNYFILSGGLANPIPGITEAKAMAKYLINKGIEKERLVLEENSLSTVENAKYSVSIIKELEADLVIVCTSLYHLKNPIYKAVESFLTELEGSNIRFMVYTK